MTKTSLMLNTVIWHCNAIHISLSFLVYRSQFFNVPTHAIFQAFSWIDYTLQHVFPLANAFSWTMTPQTLRWLAAVIWPGWHRPEIIYFITSFWKIYIYLFFFPNSIEDLKFIVPMLSNIVFCQYFDALSNILIIFRFRTFFI